MGKPIRHKSQGRRGLFDEEQRLGDLSSAGDPLEGLSGRIDWEMFRPLLEGALVRTVRGAGGARPYDYVMMFKILILQRYNHISDDRMEFAILDRLSFMRFLGVTLGDKVPDAKTIWSFRERLGKAGVIERLFEQFAAELNRAGLVASEGTIVDASFVEVPRQRNRREENALIKQGGVPADWSTAKRAQKDVEARWARKDGKSHYGYKNHIKIDARSKLIETYTVTAACVFESQVMGDLIRKKDAGRPLHGDSAYGGKPTAKLLNENQIINQTQEKGFRLKPLTAEQQQRNRIKSRTRVRVEHVFAFIAGSMGGSRTNYIGRRRNAAAVGLMNLTYNMFRALHLGYHRSASI
jgi:IS5 family transposase